MADPDLNPQVPGEDVAPVAEVPAPRKTRARAEKADEDQASQANGDNLPDQSTVDPKAITRAVLTRQGWVVPATKTKA